MLALGYMTTHSKGFAAVTDSATDSTADHTTPSFEANLDAWREHALAWPGASPAAVEAAEKALRDAVASLETLGLDADEGLVVALRRRAAEDEATQDFVRAAGDRLLAGDPTRLEAMPFAGPTSSASQPPAAATQGPAGSSAPGLAVMIALATAAALAVKAPVLWGQTLDNADGFYALNASLFCLPFVAALFAWLYRPQRRFLGAVAATFAGAAIVANAYPFVPDGSTLWLTALHLPVVLWLVIGVLTAGARWRDPAARMAYTRFTGEWFIAFVLIVLGGGVLSAMTAGVFGAIGIDAETFVSEWMLPCGGMAAVVVAAWLVETRGSLVGGIAPMLAKVFTPLFSVLMVALLAAVLWTRGFIEPEREVLILFDALLIVVVALLLYGFAARDRLAAVGWFDRLQVVLVACALAVDVYALASIAIRLSEYGFSPNKVAALGLNAILLVNLIVAAYLQVRFVRGSVAFDAVERWQMRYLPVYAAWATVVAVAFPPLFAFA